MSLAGLVALATLGALVAGCASAKPHMPSAVGLAQRTAPRGVAAPGLTELCALDSLWWSHAFVPRATSRACVTILGSVTLADD